MSSVHHADQPAGDDQNDDHADHVPPGERAIAETRGAGHGIHTRERTWLLLQHACCDVCNRTVLAEREESVAVDKMVVVHGREVWFAQLRHPECAKAAA